MQEKIINVPNAITALRLFFAAPMLFYIHSGESIYAVAFAGLIFLSDILDGYFARKLNQQTKLGEFFDFSVDYLIIYMFIGYFILQGKINLPNQVLILIGTIILGFVLFLLSKAKGRLWMPHRTSGKILSCLLGISIILFILNFQANLMLGITLILMLVWVAPDYAQFIRRVGKKTKKIKH